MSRWHSASGTFPVSAETRAERRSRRTLGEVISRYEAKELGRSAWATERGYKAMHLNYFKDWASSEVDQITSWQIGEWQRRALTSLGQEPSPKTLYNVLWHLHSLFRYAAFLGWDRRLGNPVDEVLSRLRYRRVFQPKALDPPQIRELFRGEINARDRLLLLCGCTLGLCASEMFALRWGDVELPNKQLRVSRLIVEGRVSTSHMTHRHARLPICSKQIEAFSGWRERTTYDRQHDWIFASEKLMGRSPLNVKHTRERLLHPAGLRIGFGPNLSWLVLRHSYKGLLEHADIDLGVQKALMRHADVKTTMQHYGSKHFERMREANGRAVLAAFS